MQSMRKMTLLRSRMAEATSWAGHLVVLTAAVLAAHVALGRIAYGETYFRVEPGETKSNNVPATYDIMLLQGGTVAGEFKPAIYLANAELSVAEHIYDYSGAIFYANAPVSVGLNFYVEAGARLDMNDNISCQGSLMVQHGGLLNLNSGMLTALSLQVRYNSVMNISGGDFTVGLLRVDTGGVVYGGGGQITSAIQVESGASLTLAHNLNLNDGIYIDGAGSTLTAAGYSYNAPTVRLTGGASLIFGASDIINSLTVDGNGSQLVGTQPLALSSLSVANGGAIHLGSFTGMGGAGNWGLRLAGDNRSYLESLIDANGIVGGGVPLLVTYDLDSNATYISSTAVPEIDRATGSSALSLVAGVLAMIEQRRRRATLVA
jgi:hypothetical protein